MVLSQLIPNSEDSIGANSGAMAYLKKAISFLRYSPEDKIQQEFELKLQAMLMTASIAAFANMGPLYATAASTDALWPAVGEFTVLSKLVMIVAMIFGRVEVFVFLAIFNIADWRA